MGLLGAECGLAADVATAEHLRAQAEVAQHPRRLRALLRAIVVLVDPRAARCRFRRAGCANGLQKAIVSAL